MSKKRNDARTAIRNVKWSLRLLDGEEREHAIRPLREIVLADAYERNTSSPSNPEACARCGCIDIVRRGRNQRDGSQRWLCMGCHRTFGNKTNRVIARSKLKPAVWMQYVECSIDSLSLAECAERCGVSVRTAFHMRHRIIECAQRYMSRFKARAGEQVQLDETYYRESFKGNHRKSKTFRMPREPHRHGKPANKRGLSKEQICVMTGSLGR